MIKTFHGARESEHAKRRLTTELRSTMDRGVVEGAQLPVQKTEGEGKTEHGNEQVEAFGGVDESAVRSQRNDQHHTRNAFDHQSAQAISSVVDAVMLPESTIPFDDNTTAMAGDVNSIHDIPTYLKHNYYEHTIVSARGPSPNTSSITGFPRISLDYDGNIFSWVQARQVMTTFKIRFRRRIEVVAGIFFLATGVSNSDHTSLLLSFVPPFILISSYSFSFFVIVMMDGYRVPLPLALLLSIAVQTL